MREREFDTREACILHVEDEEPILDLITTALRFTRFTVETATTGAEDLNQDRNHAWHVLELDVNLPGLNDPFLCRKLRAAGDELAIERTKRPGPGTTRHRGPGALPDSRR